jgi:hypothetical protein
VPTFTAVQVDLGGRLLGAGGSLPNPGGYVGQVNVAVDRSDGSTHGNVYLLASLDPYPVFDELDPLDVHFVRSTDGGSTWTLPVRVNDDPPGQGTWHWFGALSVAPNGRLDAIWNDTRNSGQPNISQLFYAYSMDAGSTWLGNVAVTPPWDSHVGWPQQDKIGDYYTMVSDDLGAVAAYAATFNGEQDVYFVRLFPDCNENGISDIGDLDSGTSDDCDGDWIPDECEADCNGNGEPDDCDIASGTSDDCDGDWIPDECEADCNGNGEPDDCDIASGISDDCNGNGVPDDCDIASGISDDCNGNGVPDECETDCNGNGDPDDCDVASGTSDDCNGNGEPDDCDTVVVFVDESICPTCQARDVFAADLDGDGDLDVLAAFDDTDSFAWYRNLDGAGTFGPPEIFTADANGAAAILAADLDGDGDRDVLTAARLEDEIAWYENVDGEASFFNPHVISNVADGAQDLAVADVDGDGDRDVLAALWAADEFVWYENLDGVGAFGPERVIDGGNAQAVVTADLDGDGDTDVLAGTAFGSVAWYENLDGAGAFGPAQILEDDVWAYSVFAADVDGDGDVDVAAALATLDEITWYENLDGAGTFSPAHGITTIADSARSVFLADLDGDGDIDALSASSDDDKVAWYENLDGLGTFGTEQIIATSPLADEVAVLVANLDGDGDNDVLVSTLLWYRNETPDCNGNDIPDSCELSAGTEVDWNANGIPDSCEPDCNGNGQLDSADIASASSADCNTNGVPDECDTATGASPDCDVNGVPDECEPDCNNNKTTDGCDVAEPGNDCDADGVPDDCRVDFIGRLVGLGDGARAVVAADIDGDMDGDVVSASAVDDKIAWFENVGGSEPRFVERIITVDPDGSGGPAQGAADAAWSVHAVDIDGDSDIDVLSASVFDDKIALYRNLDGQGSFGGQYVISTAANAPRSVYAADLDGDFDADVLSASESDDKIAWYENLNGATSFGPQQVISTAANGALSVYAADLDGDEDNDVLSASWLDNDIAWYENLDGDGTFGPKRMIHGFAMDAQSVFAADLDGDDDLDVLSASSGNDTIAWYENLDGQGSFGSARAISLAAAGAAAVFAADLDEDGDADVLSASSDDDTIAWYPNLDGAGTFGPQRILSSSAKGARSVFAMDLDGDGDLEVLSASFDDDEIVWYANPDDDCNLNGVPDACDLASGTSFDCDGNGQPDECGPPLPDSDADGYCDLGDCDPADNQVWSEPWPVDTLELAREDLATTLNWNQPGQPGATSVRYDLLRSPDAPDFHVPAVCLETDETDTGAQDSQTPPAGALSYYLVRVENDCPDGVGSMGPNSEGVPRTGVSCP